MDEIRLHIPNNDQPDVESIPSEADTVVGPDISVTEILMQLEQSLVDADIEIKQEKERVNKAA